jgi:hypothetical protein
MSGHDENHASAGKFGVSVPCHDENGASAGNFRSLCPAAKKIVQVWGNSWFPGPVMTKTVQV